MNPDAHETTVELPADPTSPGVARRAVRRACEGVDVDLDAVLLCTSELVTNAVLHGAPPIELAVAVDAVSVRVTVRDADAQVVQRRRPVTAETLSGRGLDIVETLASNWGSEVTATGKVSWFRIDVT